MRCNPTSVAIFATVLATVQGWTSQPSAADSWEAANGFNVQRALEDLKVRLVQDDLGLTDNQRLQIEPLKANLDAALSGWALKERHPVSGERKQSFDEVIRPATIKLVGILRPRQFDRLKQILIQDAGTDLFDISGSGRRSDVGKTLRLTSDQASRISRIIDETAQKRLKLDGPGHPPNAVTPSTRARDAEIASQEEKLDEAAYARVVQLLDGEQRKRVDELRGKPINVRELHKQLFESERGPFVPPAEPDARLPLNLNPIQ